MKPSDFTLNSDYISTTTATTITRQVTFSGGTIPAGPFTDGFIAQSADINAPKIEEAEFQYMISEDGEKWYPAGAFKFHYNNDITGEVTVSRTGPTTIQVYLASYETDFSAAIGGTFPSKQIWIKEVAIIVPDMA